METVIDQSKKSSNPALLRPPVSMGNKFVLVDASVSGVSVPLIDFSQLRDLANERQFDYGIARS